IKTIITVHTAMFLCMGRERRSNTRRHSFNRKNRVKQLCISAVKKIPTVQTAYRETRTEGYLRINADLQSILNRDKQLCISAIKKIPTVQTAMHL
ncbi:MAG: hypothetical protein K2K02_01865, partial [Ruminococcus sp.]|nr:hypothetical protein [Ruminococcus sp.]